MSKPKFSQADTIALARRIHQFLTADLVDFTAFDASFTPTYLSRFSDAITAAENHPDDETVVDIQTGYTAALADVEKRCRKAYQRLKVFVEKAFPTARSVQNEFGFNDYGNISGMAELIKFMHRIAGTANKYSNDLIAVFYTPADILGLKTLHDELVAAQNEQEAYKSERMRLTDLRDTLVNDLYTYIAYTIKVGKIIYEDNRAMYARYLLPPTNANSLPTLRIAAQAREVVAANVQEIDYYSLRVLVSGAALQFYVAPNGSTSVPTTAVLVSPSTASNDFSVEELGFDTAYTGAQSLFVYNPNMVEVGYTSTVLS